MPDFKPSPLGVLKCRDLATLYYGFPMVGVPRETLFFLTTTAVTLILGQDPRRIKYEIVLANQTGGNLIVYIGSQSQMDVAKAAVYIVPTGGTLSIKRSFLTDLDSVCLPLLARLPGGSMEISVREIILTPAPADEVLLP
jgi:hypothetical protein